MNIYQKLTEARVELQNMKLKKSGRNDYSKYDYYELGDLLPAVNKLCQKYEMTTRLNIIKDGEEKAIFTIYNATDPGEKIEFIAPTAEAQIGLKKDGTGGADPIQNLGGKITYMRRYMIVTAFEIVESDTIDLINRDLTDEVSKEDLRLINDARSIDDLTNLYKRLEKTYTSKILLPHFSKKKEELEDEAEVDQTKGQK